MIKKLRIKFVSVIMAIVFVMMCAILSFVYFNTRSSMYNQSVSMLRSQLIAQERPPRPDDISQDIKLPFFTLRTDGSGEIISVSEGYYDLSDEEFLESLVTLVESSGADIGEIPEYNLRYLKSEDHKGQVLVFADISSEQNALSSLLKTCLLIGLFAFIIFLLLSILFARWAVKPVEQAFTRQRRFIADASHELKTPLTVIITSSDLLQSGSFSEEQNGKFVSNIQQMGKQMQGLITEMLDLTRADSDAGSITTAEFSLSDAAVRTADSFEVLFFENGLTLKSQIEPGISLRGDEQQLCKLMGILLDNAKKYCSPGTETVFSVSRSHSYCTIKVADYGPEIPREDLKHIFERFYRADKSRSMNCSYGLGLSIASTIAEAHKGKIWAESENGINSFYVKLPV